MAKKKPKWNTIHLTGDPISSEYEPKKLTQIAEGILGHCARLVSGSKSLYRSNHPDHVVIFNANVFTKEDGKIWYGDIDLTLDEQRLKRLGYELEKEVFLLQEMEGRFENEEKVGDQVEQSAMWSTIRGPMNFMAEYCSRNIYVRRKGRWYHV